MPRRRARSRRAAAARAAIAALGLLAALVAAAPAGATTADERALAERFAPVVRLVDQPEECGPGEPYEPMDVDLLFDEPTVALRGPWNRTDLVKIAPEASDLARGLYEYHLDFPGNALSPGCTYEQWARRLTTGHQPAVYAHVASDPAQPGQLGLQYWLFYPFNDWNNVHEGDWEMIQLNFDAPDARTALGRTPVEVGYSQHEGAERAEWGDDKLQIVDGTHPVVYPAAGSHANFFEDALFLGASGSQGVGCDDTRGPSRELHPVVETIPSDATAAKAAYPWIAFEGRWGELQRAFYNGPTGPNLKSQWTAPIDWSEEWRDRSYAVPAAGAFGTGGTDFFCGAIGNGSRWLAVSLDHPLTALVTLAALLALIVYALSRTRWRPAAPLRLARRRAWGQVLADAARMYRRHVGLFLGIGLILIPISLVVTFVQALVLGASSFLGIADDGEGAGVLVLLVVALGTGLTLLGIGMVQAAVARALVELDGGRRVGPVEAYRLAFARLAPLLGAVLVAAVVITLLVTSLLLIPIAIWLAVRWALVAVAVELEDTSALGALHRSGRLVRRGWWKVASLSIVGGALALAIGPLLGAVLIILTDAPLSTINIVAGIVNALAIPLVALTTTYIYFDLRVREELAPGDAPSVQPAEIDVSLPPPSGPAPGQPGPA